MPTSEQQQQQQQQPTSDRVPEVYWQVLLSLQ